MSTITIDLSSLGPTSARRWSPGLFRVTWTDAAGAALPWHTRIWEALRRAGAPVHHDATAHPPFALRPRSAAAAEIVTWVPAVAAALADQPGVAVESVTAPAVPPAPGPARIRVRTETPLLFRREGRTIPHPVPEYVARGLQRLVDLAGLPVTAPVLEPTTLDGGVAWVPNPAGSGMIPGFLGEWTYDLLDAPAALRQAAGAAWMLAGLLGLGAKTGLGFGQVTVDQ